MTLLWVLGGALCAFVMMMASRMALQHAVAVSQRLRVPPFIVGFTLVAIGTDLPELVNSVVASYLDHGDINVGDSVGSVFTQGALVLGLFAFLSRDVAFRRRDVILVPALSVAALGLGIWVLGDGEFSRVDAVLLIFAWMLGTVVAWRFAPSSADAPEPPKTGHSTAVHAAIALVGLAVVGGAASGLVFAVSEVSTTLGVPEYMVSFFGASIGTSMPELAVEITALRRGESQLALGDVLGSCFVDSSLSLGFGPMLFPVGITGYLAQRGALLAIGAMVAIALLLGIRGRLTRVEGTILIGIYLAAYLFLLT